MTINTDAWTWMVDGDIPVIEQIFGLFPCVMWRYIVCSTVLLQEKKNTHTEKPLQASILGPVQTPYHFMSEK